MRREDEHVIKSIANNYNKNMLRHYLSLPFVFVDLADLPTSSSEEELTFLYEHTVGDLLNVLPANEFIWCTKDHDDDSIEHVVVNFGQPTNLDRPMHEVTAKIMYLLDKSAYPFHDCYVRVPFNEEFMSDEEDKKQLFCAPDNSKRPIPTQKSINKLKESLREINFRNMAELIHFFWDMDQKGMYPVKKETTPTKQDHKSYDRKPWVCTHLPRTLFLNQIPTEKTQTDKQGKGNGSHKSGHFRRGHWRRLTNERFRHHPQFGKKIRVKPAWIGPENAEFMGARYTLMKPVC